jgi:hypothetical protein
MEKKSATGKIVRFDFEPRKCIETAPGPGLKSWPERQIGDLGKHYMVSECTGREEQRKPVKNPYRQKKARLVPGVRREKRDYLYWRHAAGYPAANLKKI